MNIAELAVGRILGLQWALDALLFAAKCLTGCTTWLLPLNWEKISIEAPSLKLQLADLAAPFRGCSKARIWKSFVRVFALFPPTSQGPRRATYRVCQVAFWVLELDVPSLCTVWESGGGTG